MNKKTSWAIALLLAAIVPFATGCKECDNAKNQATNSSYLLDRLKKVEAKQAITSDDCSVMSDYLAVIADKTVNDKTVKSLCPDTDDMCRMARGFRSAAGELQEAITRACDLRASSMRPDKPVYFGNVSQNDAHGSDIRDALINARTVMDNRLKANGRPLLVLACSESDAQKIDKMATPVEAPNQISYAPPISYNISGPSHRPDEAPAAPVIPTPPSSGSAASAAAAPSAPLPGPVNPTK